MSNNNGTRPFKTTRYQANIAKEILSLKRGGLGSTRIILPQDTTDFITICLTLLIDSAK